MITLFDEERIVREADRRYVTGISRTKAWELEKVGAFPKRVRLGNRSVGWKLTELREWVNQQQRVVNDAKA